jgi:hypothetical protein
MSTPSSSGRGFVRGKRSIRESSADAWWAARLWEEREREENADQRRGPVKGAWAGQKGWGGRDARIRAARVRQENGAPKPCSAFVEAELFPKLEALLCTKSASLD